MDERMPEYKTYKAAIKAGAARYAQGLYGNESYVRANSRFVLKGIIYSPGDLVEIVTNDQTNRA